MRFIYPTTPREHTAKVLRLHPQILRADLAAPMRRSGRVGISKRSIYDDHDGYSFVMRRDVRDGYVVQHEWVVHNELGSSMTKMDVAYNPGGDYIGNESDARHLVEKLGLAPELASPDHRVCSVGFCEKEQAWYGWSHRAIHGFEVGYVVAAGDLTACSGYVDEYLAEHPEDDRSLPVGFEAVTLADCRRCAVAFADAVS